jgi:hypothetical protein
MSFIDIKSLVDDGRKSLENKQYWSALAIALMLPSVCSDFVYGECKAEGYSGDLLNKDHDMYVQWCDRYMRTCDTIYIDNVYKDKWLTEMLGPDYGELLYVMRCDFLHAGNILVREQYRLDGGEELDRRTDIKASHVVKRIYLTINSNISYTTQMYTILRLEDLCNTIFDYVDTWYYNWGGYLGNNIKTFIFDCSNIHDKHKLDSLLEQLKSGGK